VNIALVQSCWHRDLVDGCAEAFLADIAELLPGTGVERFEVPGAFEIPLHAKLLAVSGRFDAVACTGLVVDGGIYRHEFVAGAVIDGLMRVQLDTSVPVFTAVLTPQHFHEHDDHQRFFAEHLVGKGRELARACAQTLHSIQALPA
jgi:6,7-dimethyl-8-ribityllumazine synthase